MIWAYMGPNGVDAGDCHSWNGPAFPTSQRYLSKRLQESNWAQATEGGIDSSHISFLHSRFQRAAESSASEVRPAPVFRGYVRDGHEPALHGQANGLRTPDRRAPRRRRTTDTTGASRSSCCPFIR